MLTPTLPESTVSGFAVVAALPLTVEDAKRYSASPTIVGVLKSTLQLVFVVHSRFDGVE
jgi:hypothetical protein